MLARDVWKETARATPLDNVNGLHINRLRRKVDEPFERQLIHTVACGIRCERKNEIQPRNVRSLIVRSGTCFRAGEPFGLVRRSASLSCFRACAKDFDQNLRQDIETI